MGEIQGVSERRLIPHFSPPDLLTNTIF